MSYQSQRSHSLVDPVVLPPLDRRRRLLGQGARRNRGHLVDLQPENRWSTNGTCVCVFLVCVCVCLTLNCNSLGVSVGGRSRLTLISLVALETHTLKPSPDLFHQTKLFLFPPGGHRESCRTPTQNAPHSGWDIVWSTSIKKI